MLKFRPRCRHQQCECGWRRIVVSCVYCVTSPIGITPINLSALKLLR